MANITLTNFVDNSDGWYGDSLLPAGDATTHTSTKFSYTTTTGHVVTLTGTGFTYNGPDGSPSDGTITGFTLSKGGNAWITATSLQTDFADAFYTVVGWDRPDGSHQNGDSFDAFSVLTAGGDLINGSNADDDMIAGRNGGDDTMNGLGGNDYMKGSAGDNTLDGGTGRDTLSYAESFYDRYAVRGATINLKTGVVLNPWGGTDTVDNFEAVQGSRLADKITGTTQGDWFAGLRGKDTMDGGSDLRVNNIADYQDDAQYGGRKGIDVNLDTGKIIDGFGSTDTVKNIGTIVGTNANDTFVGGAGQDQFLGGKGVDSYNGGDGNRDLIAFWNNDWQGATKGVKVNLGLSTLQVQDDGYGNKEGVTNIEWLVGSNKVDTLTGDGHDNDISGQGGKDVLDGAGGFDTVSYFNEGGSIVLTLNGATAITVTRNGTAEDTIKNFEGASGGNAGDKLAGDGLVNKLMGFGGNDTLSGAGGSDSLIGGNGNDKLTGGAAADKFIFDAELNASTNVDTITDFNVSQGDIIQLDNAVMTALGTTAGPLGTQFFAGADAVNGNDPNCHIVYNTTNGELRYDSNGDDAGGTTLIAIIGISSHPTLGAGSFEII